MPWLDVVGWCGSALLVFSLLQARVLRFRVLNSVGCVVMIFYNSMLSVWPIVALNATLLGINIWFINRLVRERHDEAVFEVLEVGAYDDYLRHVLRVHGDDILKFQPDFVWDPDTEHDHAFIVIKGDETVGVVIVTREDDVARIRLDYVTPKYRDFTPGEFVWRRSGVLNDLGISRVTTPPNMVNAYYPRVGFRPAADDTYALDV